MKNWSAMEVTTDIRAVLVDLSGTLHVDDFVFPGVYDGLQRLRDANIQLRFITNTTRECKRILQQSLGKLGFKASMEEIFTSLSVARKVVESKHLRPMLILENLALEDFDGISTDEPNAVVIGLAPSKFNYDTMQTAFRLLLKGAPLIAVYKGRYKMKKEGLVLGPGPFVTGLEFAADVTAEVIGKPAHTFFKQAVKNLQCSPDNVIMIGDDVWDDIAGAQNAGIRGILVKTGKYRENDELKIQPGPYSVCDDFTAAVDFILNENRQMASNSSVLNVDLTPSILINNMI